MKKNRHTIVLICALIVILLCGAIEGKAVSPTVDIEISLQDDEGVSMLTLDFYINNPNRREIFLNTLKYNVKAGPNRCEATWGISKRLEPCEPFIFHRKLFSSDEGINVTVKGWLFVKVDADSFEGPFEKTTTVYLKTDEEKAKLATCPNITGMELRTSKLVLTSGEITDFFVNMNINITNPNPIAVYLSELGYNVNFKKDGKWVRLFSWSSYGYTIEPMDSYTISVKRRIWDDEIIQYLMRGNSTDIEIRGEMFVYPKGKEKPPCLECSFEKLITINGAGIAGEVTPTSTPFPTAPPTEPIPGFEVVSAIAGLLAVAYLLRRRN